MIHVMAAKTTTTLALATSLLAAVVSAQQDEGRQPDARKRLRAAVAEVEWTLDADGQVLIAPHPDGSTQPTPACNPLLSPTWLSVGGSFFPLLAHGHTDLASIGDPEQLCKILGFPDDDRSLIERLQGNGLRGSRQAQNVQRLLSIRLAQARGYKAAVPFLRQIARGDPQDPTTELAVAEALDVLIGESFAPRIPERPSPPPMEETSTRIPKGTNFLAHFDHERFPSARPVLSIIHEAAFEGILRVDSGHLAHNAISQFEAAAIARLTAFPSLLTYEIARRLGNHRISRTMFAMRLASMGPESFTAVFEGLIDAEALFAGLEAEGARVTRDVGPPVSSAAVLDTGLRVALEDHRIHVSGNAEEGELLTAERYALLDGPEPIRVALLDDFPLPGVAPCSIGIDIPPERSLPIRVSIAVADEERASELKAQITRLIDQCEERVGPETFAWLRSFAIVCDGAVVRVTAPREGVDLDTRLRDLLIALSTA